MYDTTAALSADDVASLERKAANLDQAGAPTVVYLRVRVADSASTQKEARDLMHAWGVESAPGAMDGLVVLVNIGPHNSTNGYGALVAGAHHVYSGRLPAGRMQAIYDDQMKPRLDAGYYAEGISNALDQVARDLRQTPGTTVLDLVNWLFVGIVILIVDRMRRRRGERSGRSSTYSSYSSTHHSGRRD